MTALTTMFNFLVVYTRYFASIVFGGSWNIKNLPNEQYEIARNLFDTLGFPAEHYTLHSDGNPILMIFLGVFVIGAIIGLARRLIRG